MYGERKNLNTIGTQRVWIHANLSGDPQRGGRERAAYRPVNM